MRRVGWLLAIVVVTGGGCQTILNLGEGDDGEPARDAGASADRRAAADDGMAADGATQDAADGGCGDTTFSASNCGRCGRKCNLGGACTSGRCERPVVFVTSGTKSGAFGGEGGADQYCNSLANKAGLGGEFRAWLGPSSRFPLIATSYYRLDGAGLGVVSRQWPPGDTLELPIRFDERGVGATGRVWTNLDGDGGPSGLNDCLGWVQAFDQQGGYGDCTQTDFTWTRGPGVRMCNEPLHLYCVELL